MYEKEKEKRKGRPRRNWRILVLCLLIMGLLGFYVYMKLVPPPAPPTSALLTAFDINEEADEIALGWWDGSSRTGLWGTRPWSDVQSGATTTTLLGSDEKNVWQIAYQPHTTTLYTSLTHTEGVIRLENDQVIQLPEAFWPEYSPSGHWLAYNKFPETLFFDTNRPDQTYDPARPDKTLPIYNGSEFNAISPDDTTLATVGSTGTGPDWEDETIDLYDIETGQQVRRIIMDEKGSLGPIVYSPDGTQLAIGNSPQPETGIYPRILLLDLDTEAVHILHTTNMQLNQIFSRIEYDPTGRWLAVGDVFSTSSDWGGINVYDLASDNREGVIVFIPVTSRLVKVQFVQDGLVIGTEDNRLGFWQWTGETWTNTATWSVALEN